jgi:hypothetical protein
LIVDAGVALAVGVTLMGLGSWLLKHSRVWELGRSVRSNATRVLWPSLVSSLAVWVVVAHLLGSSQQWLHDYSQAVGSVGVAAFAFALVVFVGMSLVGLGDAVFYPPRAFRLLGYAHTPVVSLILVWWFLASALPPEEATHDARRTTTAAARTTETLRARFDSWLARQCPIVAGPNQTPVVPLVIVATAGGGARAATWTTYVLDRTLGYDVLAGVGGCAANPAPRAADRVFAMSGISGGSVGLSTYSARLAAYDTGAAPLPDQDNDNLGSNTRGWIRRQLGISTLAPTVSWLLFEETPWSWLRYPLETDRAVVLENTWERHWWGFLEPPKLFDLQRRAPRVPLLVLNSTSAESGCRLNVSVLRLSSQTDVSTQRCLAEPLSRVTSSAALGATVDVGELLCRDEDLWLSTAALLSARWPYISPSGRVLECATDDQAIAGPDVEIRTYGVDGGYHEGSGAATALDLWQAIEPLVLEHNQSQTATQIVPLAIQIDNGYSEPAGPGVTPSQPQLLVPPMAFWAANAAASERTRQALRLVFEKPFPLSGAAFCRRYVHFNLQPHPGPEATVGWTLSDVSFDDMVSQIGAEPAMSNIATVRGWLVGSLDAACVGI